MWAGGVWVTELLSFFWMLTLLAPLLTSSFLHQRRRLHSLLSMLCFVKWCKSILSKVLLFLLICNISEEEVCLPCKSVSRLISSLLPPCHPSPLATHPQPHHKECGKCRLSLSILQKPIWASKKKKKNSIWKAGLSDSITKPRFPLLDMKDLHSFRADRLCICDAREKEKATLFLTPAAEAPTVPAAVLLPVPRPPPQFGPSISF